MAPYTFNIKMINKADRTLRFVDWASYPVDGRPTGWGDGAMYGGQIQDVANFKKSGGTDGLFSGALWKMQSGNHFRFPVVPALFVYARMPASSGGKVTLWLSARHEDPDRNLSSKNFVEQAEAAIQKGKTAEFGIHEQSSSYGYNSDGFESFLSAEVKGWNGSYPDASCSIEVNWTWKDRRPNTGPI